MFRFTIRELVLLTLVVAMGVCGCGRKARIIRGGIDDAVQHATEVEKAAAPNQ